MNILLSIKPEFVEKIISEQKQFEYRRKLPKHEIDKVIVYATLPIGKVVGEFSVKRTLSLPPDELWQQTSEYAGIDKLFFSQYFNRCDVAHAFQIDKFSEYQEPKSLLEFVPSGRAPQSFCYVK